MSSNDVCLGVFLSPGKLGQDAVKASTSLKNTKIVVHFDARGLRDIYDQAQHRHFGLPQTDFPYSSVTKQSEAKISQSARGENACLDSIRF